MTYEDEIAAGQAALKRRDAAAARFHFGRAHGAGHEIRCRHVMAHRGLLEASVQMRDIREIASQLFLIVATYIFDKPARA